MKILFALAIAAVWSSTPAFAQRSETTLPLQGGQTIPWAQLPQTVQQHFKYYAGKDAIVGVQKGTVEGQTVYIAPMQRDGKPVEIVLTENGSVFTPSRSVAWNELPTAVQESFSSLNNREAVKGIEVQEQGPQTVYDFSLNNRGEQSNLQLGKDGGIVGVRTNQAETQPAITESAGAARPATIKFENLSRAAQETIKSATGGKAIRRIESEVVNGVLCYEVKYDEGGQAGALCVSNDGQIINPKASTKAGTKK